MRMECGIGIGRILALNTRRYYESAIGGLMNPLIFTGLEKA